MAEFERYFSTAKQLKIFGELQKPRRFDLIRNMSNYDLSVFAVCLGELISVMGIHAPNIMLSTKQNVKNQFSKASNILESVVGGLAEKVISKEIARQEILQAAFIINQVRLHLLRKGEETKALQIADINIASASFKEIDLRELDQYVNKIKDIEKSIAPIQREFSKSTFKKETPVFPEQKPASEDHLPADPYASPSKYGDYLSNFSQKYHDAFSKASRQIKIPSTIGPDEASGQTLWGICRLPLWLVSNPPLRKNELDRNGIKYSELDKNSFILYNQIVLAVYNTRNVEELNETLTRAKKSIRLQLKSDFTYAKPFQSKEVKKPLLFYWLMPTSERLSPFTLSSIGLPFTPELTKVEDLTNDIKTIRQRRDVENQQEMERVKELYEMAQPLLEQFENIQKQIKDVRNSTKQLTNERDDLQIVLKREKLNQQSMRQNSKEWQAQQTKILALESKIGILKDSIINNTKVRMIGLKEKIEAIQKAIKDFGRHRG